MDTIHTQRPLLLSALQLSMLPSGQISRALVELAHDGMARPIRVPIVVAKGRSEGPVFGLTAAVHGNELNGLPVLHQLFDWIEPKKLKGTIVGVLAVNVPGILMFQREFIDGTDLNRIMPGKADGNISEVYAHRFVDRIVKHFDYLIDLHTASFGRVNSLYVRADMKQEKTSRMAYLQRPQIIVHNEASDRTLRGTTMELKIPSITVEIGDPQRFKPEFIKRSVMGIRAVLGEFGLLPKTKISLGQEPVICDRSKWIYTDHGGLLTVFPQVAERVETDQVLARLTNVFGDLLEEYRAPEDGIVVGRSVNPIAQTGARIVQLGHVADATSAQFKLRS